MPVCSITVAVITATVEEVVAASEEASAVVVARVSKVA